MLNTDSDGDDHAKFNNRRATRGTVAIMLGAIVGQSAGLFAAPLLARLYSPESFGVFSVITAVSMTLGGVLALRFELAIPLANSSDEARALMRVGLCSSLILAALLSVGALLVRDPVYALVNDRRIADWIPLAPLAAFPVALFGLLNQSALRQQQFVAVARRNLMAGISTVAVQLLAGLRTGSPGGLIAGSAAGQLVGVIPLLKVSDIWGRVPRSLMMATARQFRRFPLMLAPAGLLNAASLYLPVVLIASTYGPTAAGWFGLTQRILSAPVAVVGQAIAQVYLSELAMTVRLRSNQGGQLFVRASKRLALVGVAAFSLTALLSPSIFPAALGSPWSMSGDVAQALALPLGLQFLAAPLSQTLVVYRRSGTQLAWDCLRMTAVIAAVLVPYVAQRSFIESIWVLAFTLSTFYAISWYLSLRTIRSTRGG